jgi:AmmeMemoRadiSam system protein A
MDPTDSTEARSGKGAQGERAGSLSGPHRSILRRVALESIAYGLERGRALPVDIGEYPDPLRQEGAVFVTLEIQGRLRGCIGSYLPRRSLVEDVAGNAFAAAFRDPRFPPLNPEELSKLDLHISRLAPPAPLSVASRQELLRALRPGVDGLFLEDPPHRATFLPQVWRTLPDPADFLEELLAKADLPRDHWSGTLRLSVYSVEEF